MGGGGRGGGGALYAKRDEKSISDKNARSVGSIYIKQRCHAKCHQLTVENGRRISLRQCLIIFLPSYCL